METISRPHVKLLILISFFLSFSLVANPWGKDADLLAIDPRKPHVDAPKNNLSQTLIEFHQDHISRTDGPRSHFVPSSSQYTKEAMLKYGFFWGYVMGCDRLLRENNETWIYQTIEGNLGPIKYDPVR